MTDTVGVQQALWYRTGRVLGMVAVSLVTQGALMIALLPLLLPWIWFLLAPVISFTFTDPQDFIAVSLIALTLLAGVEMRHMEVYSVKRATAAAFVLSIATPLIPMIFLYLLSSRGAELIGHWPVERIKHIGADDPVFQRLRIAVVYASAFAGWGLVTWGALMVHLSRCLSGRKLLRLATAFVLAWWAFLLEPTGRFFWWLSGWMD